MPTRASRSTRSPTGTGVSIAASSRSAPGRPADEEAVPDEAAGERSRIVEAFARRRDDGRGAAPFFGLEEEAHLLRLQERRRRSLALLRRAGIDDLSGLAILDVGCGEGWDLAGLVQLGAHPERTAGIDLRPGALARAARRLPTADLRRGCGTALPWSDGGFDLVLFSTVFSSVLDGGMRARLAAEAARVLAPAGAVLCYDTVRANPANPDVRRFPPRELDPLFPAFARRTQRLTFLPHVARRLPAGTLALLYPLLAAVPAWRSHHLSLLTRVRP